MSSQLLLVLAATVTIITSSPCNSPSDAPCVSGLHPTKGSLNGATRLTIAGLGFIDDLYTQTMEVALVSETQQVNCTLHPDGCTETQIMCYTERMPEGDYYVRVTLNEVALPVEAHCNDGYGSACRFQALESHTPTITAFPLKSSVPGESLFVEGKLFSSLYGTHEGTSSNGREVRFVRVWTNSGLCDLVNSNGDFFDMSLDGDEGEQDTGHFECHPTGTYVGNQNLTYIINGTFGRSLPDVSLLRVMANNDIAMFQTYAEVTGVSHSSGSTEGGVPLTISGNFFDNTRGTPHVKVGGQDCDDVEISADYNTITCTAPEEPATAKASGNRGISVSYWNNSVNTNDDDATVRAYTSPDHEEALEEFKFGDELAESFSIAILKGYFVAPSDNRYKFLLRADDSAVLYMATSGVEAEATEAAQADTFNYNTAGEGTEDMLLSAGQEVYMEVVARNLGGPFAVSLSVHMYETVYTASQTGTALNEEFTITTSSDVVNEVQRLTLDSWVESTNIREEHQSYEINVESDPDFCFYRIGLFGAYTRRIAVSATPIDIKTELLKHPFFATTSAETILEPLKEELTQTSWKYTLKFKYLGNYHLISIQRVSLVGADCIMTISQPEEEQAGLPTGQHIVPFFDGVPGKPIAQAEVNVANLRDSLTTLFSVQCPTYISRPSDSRYSQDFEGSTDATTTSEYEPFCGRNSATMRSWQYSMDMYNTGRDEVGNWLGGITATFGIMCFAYRGPIVDSIGVRYRFEDQILWRNFPTTLLSSYAFQMPSYYLTSWNYVCFNLFSRIYSDNAAVTSPAAVDILQVQVSRSDISSYGLSTEDYPFLVDTISFTQIGTTDEASSFAMYGRLKTRNWIAESVSVAEVSADPPSYDATIVTLECAYNLPLISFAFGSGAYTNADSAIWSFQDGASVSVERQSAASPPVQGTVRISVGGSVLSMNAATTEASQLAGHLTSLRADIGDIHAEREGDCRGYEWTVEFTSIPGDHIDIEDGGSAVTGVNAAVTVEKVHDGGLHWNPIPADLLRTAHDQPQVVVAINSIPSKCTGDCFFAWDDAQTPTITGISPSSGGYGISVTISGSGFSTVASENEVMVGRAACTVNSASASSLTCTVGEGLPGERAVSVVVVSKGSARADTPVTFTYSFSVSGVSPSSGSSAGGAMLTVSGTGFGDEVSITIGGEPCDITESSYTEITCVAPSGSAGAQSVVVTENGATASGSHSFTFSAPSAAITGLSTSTANVGGDTEATITGSGFGASSYSDDDVLVGTVSAEILSWTDTEIQVALPAMERGGYTLNVKTSDAGFADRTVSTNVDYILRVDGVFPRQGSLMGGQKLTLTGQGFSTSGLNEITVGASACREESATDSQIICQLDYATNVHSITNQGSHLTLGQGYAWSSSFLTVEQGDWVEFSWSTPDSVQGVGYRVVQVTAPASTTGVSGGFSSSDIQTANGVYRYQFTRTGTFYYYSGAVTSTGVGMWGTVSVTAKEDYALPLSMTIGGVEAEYDTASGASAPANASACAPLLSEPSGCSQTRGSDAAVFDIAMWECMMPTVTAISPRRVTAGQAITVTGTGFSTTACQNEVTVEPGVLDIECVVSSAAATQIVCSVPASCEGLPTNVPLTLQVRVNNYGYALDTQLSKINRGIELVSAVTSVTPSSGSTQGGQIITITGTNFCYMCGEGCGARRRRSNLQDYQDLNGGSVEHSATAVNVCDNVISESPEEIVCETRAAPGNQFVVVQTQTMDGAVSESTCSGTCTVALTTAATPTVTAVSPASITANGQTLTLTGSRFGTDPLAVSVSVGTTPCTVLSVTDSQVTCDVGSPLGGVQFLHVSVDGLGNADLSIATIDVVRSITSVFPATFGPTGGALLTIEGVGFAAEELSISVGGSACAEITHVTNGEVHCVAPALAEGIHNVTVTSQGVTVTYSAVTVSSASQPTVSGVSPSSDVSGADIVVSGSGLLEPVAIVIDGAECDVHTYSGDGSSVTCTLGAHPAGIFDVEVTVVNFGLATGSVSFTYEMTLASLSHTSGSFGGGQLLTLSGRGFTLGNVTVTICGETCLINSNLSTSDSLVCKTPSNPGSGSVQCDVTVTDNVSRATASLANGYTYTGGAQVTSVSPARGGTGGGTTVTIGGSGFGSDPNAVTVDIAGSECVISSVADSQIVCVTEPHEGSVITEVQVQLGETGIAQQVSAGFEYIDVWSSPFTWGNEGLPVAGDFVVIPEGMTVLLDTETPVLKILLIDGGSVIFENTPEANVHLQAEIIFIADGGTLQVGTEDEPYQGQATIQMHGHVRSKELPIYGTKVLAVRQGTLDLHGRPTLRPWTRLGATASPGASTITVEQDIDWVAGDQIVIATTGDRLSTGQNEQRTITAVSGRTLTLDSPLEFQHLGEDISFQGQVTLEARAEVGLLTRNVRFIGNDDSQWHDEIEACPNGFNPGEFATQTCFQGRFGEEIASSEFGAIILMHAPTAGMHDLEARIANVELNFVGQAFRLGRYAIHYHLLGDMEGSYVRSCAIHKSFNRAVNVHQTHNVLIEHNVAFNIMGGAFFLEDGVEIGNVFQYNLAIFVKSSTSLQNDDITPAAYWVTNANNTYQHNHAAGGTHFGFWYRMHKQPDGPSFAEYPNYCPQKIPMGHFENNTVHSQGWFGIWIFQVFTPVEGGCCECTVPAPARFHTLTAWNCEKGAEWVGGGAIQWIDFKLFNNEKAGIEMKMILQPVYPYDEDHGAMISGGFIVGNDPSDVLANIGTKRGIIAPYDRGLIVRDVHYINFVGNQACYGVTQIDGITQDNNGGFTYQLSGHQFTNVDNKVFFRWEHEAVFKSMDSSFTGTDGDSVVACTGILPPSCVRDVTTAYTTGAVDGCVCPSSVKFHRFSYNHYSPSSLEGKNASFTNAYGTSIAQHKAKRRTHKDGWMIILPSRDSFLFEFVNAEQIVNISYDGILYDVEPTDWLLLTYEFYQRPDAVNIIPDSSPELHNQSTPVSYIGGNLHGDYFIETFEPQALTNNTASVLTLLSGLGHGENASDSFIDRAVTLDVYRCFFEGCITPPDPATLPPTSLRPPDAVFWSNPDIWAVDDDGNVVGSLENAEAAARRRRRRQTDNSPTQNAEIVIAEGSWVVLDVEDLPQFSRIWVYGVLEFEWEGGLDLSLSATHILVAGGRLIVGWEDHPISGSASIELRGDWFTDDIVFNAAPNIGSKVLGIFGGLDMHGQEVNVTWTQLETTAAAGATSVTMEQEVDWQVGQEIVIATTSYSMYESEKRTITAVSVDGRTLSFAEPLLYKHEAVDQDIGNGETFRMASEVGLLSRNVRIFGRDYMNGRMREQGFGGRLFVSSYQTADGDRTGWARLSHVEFYYMGQEGWSDFFDPRYALAFLDTGDVTDAKPSYVTGCAIHDSYNSALGVYGANGMHVSSNVIYRTVGSSVVIWDQDHVVTDNLVLEMLYSGTWNGRRELRGTWYAMMVVTNSFGMTLEGNHVAGGERGGYRVDGEVCGEAPLFGNNVAHSCQMGLFMLPDESDGLYPCTLLNGFRTWRNFDCGVYAQLSGSLELVNHISIDDLMGFHSHIYGPSALAHLYEDKTVTVVDSHYVGYSDTAQCSDGLDNDARFNNMLFFSSKARNYFPSLRARSGLGWGTFSQGSNAAPLKPFFNQMSYQAICGKTTVSGTVLKNYDMRCASENNVKAFAFIAPLTYDDAIHPMYTHDMTVENVPLSNMALIPEPNVGKINPADCVDMDCDGLKKAFISDDDGTLLGQRGAIVAFSEFEWDGDRRRGTGDYRIPRTMLTTPDGTQIQIADMATTVGRGIVRSSAACELRTSMNAHLCLGSDTPAYHMLMLESMDEDTETRRVSPIAVMNIDPEERYIDLINGPQDHGWCNGYTCQKRLSTFPIVFGANKSYELHFSGTTPQHLRMHWLNSEESSPGDAVVIGIYYSNPYRLDIMVDGEYRRPVNAYDDDDGNMLLLPGDHTLDLTTVAAGDNWFQRDYATQWVSLKGSALIDIVTTPLVFVNFDMPFMTTDEFFGPNIISNFAAFFEIPADRIKVATAVRSDGSRKKRTDVIEVTIEISNPPHDLGVTDPSDLTLEELQTLASLVIDTYQLGELEDVLELTILSLSVTEPVPGVESDEWQYLVQIDSSTEVTVQIPDLLNLQVAPQAQHESAPFLVQPSLKTFDAAGDAVTSLGSLTSPWEVTAYLYHVSSLHSEAELIGETSAAAQNGWFNFTDLGVSHTGSYYVEFIVTSPESASHLRTQTDTMFVDARELTALVTVCTNSTIAGTAFDVTVGLADAFTGELVEDIAWRGHTWTVTVGLFSLVEHRGPLTLNGTDTASLDPATGLATFSDLSLPTPGRYFLQFQFVSSPQEYDVIAPATEAIDVYPEGYESPEGSQFDRVTLRFEGSYSEVAYGYEDYFAASVYNVLFENFYERVSFDDFEVYEGSIMVEFDINGDEEDIDEVLEELFQMVADGLDVTFNGYTVTTTGEMWVNGEDYEDDEEDEDESLPAWAAVLIGIACVALVGVTLAFIIYCVYSKKRLDYEARKMHEEQYVKRQSRQQRRHTVVMSDTSEEGDYYHNIREDSTVSGSSLQSGSHNGDEDLMIPSAAPVTATYTNPEKAAKLDFVNVRPLSPYERPGMLSPLGSAMPRTPDLRSTTAISLGEELQSPDTPEFGRHKGNY